MSPVALLQLEILYLPMVSYCNFLVLYRCARTLSMMCLFVLKGDWEVRCGDSHLYSYVGIGNSSEFF